MELNVLKYANLASFFKIPFHATLLRHVTYPTKVLEHINALVCTKPL